MDRSTDDRSGWESDLRKAEAALHGKLWDRIAFLVHFNPQRVLALLHKLTDHDRVLNVLEDSWEKERELEREVRRECEAKIGRIEKLIPLWTARTPNVRNGWVEELQEALADPVTPEDPEPGEPEPEPEVAA